MNVTELVTRYTKLREAEISGELPQEQLGGMAGTNQAVVQKTKNGVTVA